MGALEELQHRFEEVESETNDLGYMMLALRVVGVLSLSGIHTTRAQQAAALAALDNSDDPLDPEERALVLRLVDTMVKAAEKIKMPNS